jgi:hypothetical protein
LFGVSFLDEGKERVDEDHDDDRDCQRGRAADGCEQPSQPQEQSQGMDELAYELA